MARTGSKETWFTVFASVAAAFLVVLAMLFIGAKLLLT